MVRLSSRPRLRFYSAILFGLLAFSIVIGTPTLSHLSIGESAPLAHAASGTIVRSCDTLLQDMNAAIPQYPVAKVLHCDDTTDPTRIRALVQFTTCSYNTPPPPGDIDCTGFSISVGWINAACGEKQNPDGSLIGNPDCLALYDNRAILNMHAVEYGYVDSGNHAHDVPSDCNPQAGKTTDIDPLGEHPDWQCQNVVISGDPVIRADQTWVDFNNWSPYDCLQPWFLSPYGTTTLNPFSNRSVQFELKNTCDTDYTIPTNTPFTIRAQGSVDGLSTSWPVVYTPPPPSSPIVISPGSAYVWSWDESYNASGITASAGSLTQFAVQFDGKLKHHIQQINPITPTSWTDNLGTQAMWYNPCTDPNIKGVSVDLAYCFSTTNDPQISTAPVPVLSGASATLISASAGTTSTRLASGPAVFGNDTTSLSLSGITLMNQGTNNLSGSFDVTISAGFPGKEMPQDLQTVTVKLAPQKSMTLPTLTYSSSTIASWYAAFLEAAREDYNDATLLITVTPTGKTVPLVSDRIPLVTFSTAYLNPYADPNNSANDATAVDPDAVMSYQSNAGTVLASTSSPAILFANVQGLGVAAGVGGSTNNLASVPANSKKVKQGSSTRFTSQKIDGTVAYIHAAWQPTCFSQNTDCTTVINAPQGSFSYVDASGKTVSASFTQSTTILSKLAKGQYLVNGASSNIRICESKEDCTQANFNVPVNSLGISSKQSSQPIYMVVKPIPSYGETVTNVYVGLPITTVAVQYDSNKADTVPISFIDDSADISKAESVLLPTARKVIASLATMPKGFQPPFSSMKILFAYPPPSHESGIFDSASNNLYVADRTYFQPSYAIAKDFEDTLVHESMHSIDFTSGGSGEVWKSFGSNFKTYLLQQMPLLTFKLPEANYSKYNRNLVNSNFNVDGGGLWNIASWDSYYNPDAPGGYPYRDELMLDFLMHDEADAKENETQVETIVDNSHFIGEAFAEEASTACVFHTEFTTDLNTLEGRWSLAYPGVPLPANFAAQVKAMQNRVNSSALSPVYAFCRNSYTD